MKTQTQNFQGTSQAGDFKAALGEATSKALHDLSGNVSDRRIAWKPIEPSGSTGGIAGEESLTVTIEAQPN
ncbi:MAG: hypothetical protein KME17_15530 [Cyanosarcina radialis HA8281-LM2]|nr:hypothetical protein [Cyanosarcina radialis HA8281-LM2]